jgi:hypothetical protein
VGCGAGTAALLAAQAGAAVVSTDIDGRALAFAAANAYLNDVRAVFLEGDLYAGVEGRYAAVCFNAPLVRAPMAGGGAGETLYLRSPRESLAVEFLAGARARTAPGGEALCHVQLTEEVTAAVAAAGSPAALEVHFADAVDGTPHGLVSLREGARHDRARVRVPLGAALPHLGREVLDRLHATLELAASGALPGGPLGRSAARPPPWLELVRVAVHDGAGFRPRALRLGAARLEAEDLALLEAARGQPLDELAPDGEGRARALALVGRGLLVV